MTERVCGWHECNKPLVQRSGEHDSNFRDRLTCNQSCGSKLGQWRAAQTRNGIALVRATKPKMYEPPWPKVTGQWPDRWARTKPFRQHNIATNDGGFFYRPKVADTQSYIGCAAALLVRSAVP